MKINLVIVALALAVAVVMVAGCTSSNDTGSTPTTSAGTSTAPTSGTANPSTGGSSGTPTNRPISPTDAQKSQAASLAEANSTISNALASGYKRVGVSFVDFTIPTVVVQYMKSAETEMDEYFVIVDLSQNKVTDITYRVFPLPTPQPVT